MVFVQKRINNLGGALGSAIGTLGGTYAGQQYNDFREKQNYQLQQQRQNEQEQKKQSILNQALTEAQQVYSNENLSPEEKTIQLYKVLSKNPEIAKSLSNDMLEHRKLSQPKALPGGLSGQPVPEQVGQSIANIVQNNPDLTSDQLAIEFDKASIPRTYSNSYIENRRRQDESKVNQGIATETQENKNKLESEKQKRKEQLDFHKESKDYDEELLNNLKSAKKQIEALKNIKEAIKSGNVKPTSLSNIFKGFGVIGDKISKALLNENESKLLALIPNLLEGWKEVFGVRLTDADLKLLEDKLPSLSKTPEANNAVVRILEKYSDQTILRGQIANDIKHKNKGLRPLEYKEMIEQRFDEMTQPVKIINPRNGHLIEVPAFELSDAIKSGAKIAPNETNFGTREANE